MRILEVCVDLDGGGIDRYLLNYCSRIPEIHFDFAVVDNKIGILEPQLEALGCHIYRVPRQSHGVRANYNALKRILSQNTYDAVHVHLGYRGAVALWCAKRCGVKTRIVHAHIAAEPESTKQRLVRKGFTLLVKKLATHLAACGVDAAKWVWGGTAYAKGKVTIHNNAIETAKYAYSAETRTAVRAALGIKDTTLAVGHVGRLSAQKNQLRLLDIFGEIHRLRPDSVLLLVGRGDLEEPIRRKAEEMGLLYNVCLLGVRDDVPRLLSAFDTFVFPSTHEGLPFTLIETQCNGLPAVSADTVTPLVKLGEDVRFLSLAQSNTDWAQAALTAAERGHDHAGAARVADAGYDIDREAARLRDYYINAIEAGKV
ncbi:MAG: glycosyltransferase [Clostridia bacterium]|nr:glycosyltransferase [Clostridia bacterium]